MKTVLITTDFSAASRHALDYACNLLRDKEVMLDLLHIFPVAVTYTTEGAALASMSNAIDHAEGMMEDEIAWATSKYPGIRMESRIITGSFLETLRQEVQISRPLFMILGTAGFADLSLGDIDPLNALRSVQVPVLFVPQGAVIRPVKKVAYACNYAYTGAQTPVPEIINWISFMDAGLEMIHADPQAHGENSKQVSGEQWMREQLLPLQPEFHWVQDKDVVKGISSFIHSHDNDCVLVVPRKYGLFEGIFRESRTKALARLNKVPVIAFHERD